MDLMTNKIQEYMNHQEIDYLNDSYQNMTETMSQKENSNKWFIFYPKDWK